MDTVIEKTLVSCGYLHPTDMKDERNEFVRVRISAVWQKTVDYNHLSVL